jgi:cyclopropane-fatty-acyl-phospholipid synthase
VTRRQTVTETSELAPQDTRQKAEPGESVSEEPYQPAALGRFQRMEFALLERLLRALGQPALKIQLWNGQVVNPNGSVAPVLRIRDRATLWKLALDPLFEFGEAYADGRLEVDGDLCEALTEIYRRGRRFQSRRSLLRKLIGLRHKPHRNSLAGSKNNIHRHYDIGNDFYRLWLDEELLYTCAYFREPSISLEDAQTAKMRLVCQKLRLKPGERVLEAGCGWGALALYMARHFGVSVRAYNISKEQVAFGRQRAEREGLGDRVQFVQDDWRTMNEPCDAFVSVGMLEHVGLQNYRQLGEVISQCLGPRGRGLIHTIGQTRPNPFNPWIERRVFPGAYPPTLKQMMDIFEPGDLAIQDVENLRPHYAETLRHWRQRFEHSVEAIREMFDDRFVRMWRLYLCGSIAAFEAGGLQLFQLVFTRIANEEWPWTRADIYTDDTHVPSNGHPQPPVEGRIRGGL